MNKMSITLKIAEANPVQGLPQMAAVLFDKRHIAGVGLNSRKTDPFQKRFAKNPLSVCLHAEIACIKNALRHYSVDDLPRMTMVVARVKRDGTSGSSKPCCGCARALIEFGINNVIYKD